MSDERARRKRFRRRLNNVILLANALGAASSTFYFILSGLMPISLDDEDGMVSLIFSIVMTAVLLFLGTRVGRKREDRAWEWYIETADQQPQPPAPDDIQRHFLNQPVMGAMTSFLMWLLAGVLVGWGMGSDSFRLGLLAFLGVSGLAGVLASLLVYFIDERMWRSELPIIFPEGNLGDVEAFRLTVRWRILILFVMSSLPLILVALTAYQQAEMIVAADDPALFLRRLRNLEIFLVGVGMVVVVTLGVTLGSSLIDPIETLQEQMKVVRQGDLEVDVQVTSNDELGDLAAGFNAMLNGLRQEEVVRQLFSLYVTPEVAEHAIQHGAELGGQLTDATVLFSDIRGFTAMTEQLGPERIIGLLNRYFDAMSDAIVVQGGLVNKFGGDSLLAVFGAPLHPAPDHAARAVRAAQAMLAALDTFNAEQIARGEPALRIGIGIATGPVVAGNVGSEERLEYTVIGDTVNLASRLESMTKELEELDATVLLSSATAEALAVWSDLLPAGKINVRGKQAPVRVYTLKDTQQMEQM
jgi:adenylate cyclase